jgi:hypothetical protein
MEAERDTMYKLPWSTFDNQAGWIEVTDRCNITCPGCYRQRLEGDRPLEKIKTEILQCEKLVNCDSVIIAGGEPLVYPYIIEVIQYIASLGLKPLLLTNGVLLTREIALELKKAGLKRVHFHVDARQGREGWMGKNETDMNQLRDFYANMIHKVKGIQCGFHITVAGETMGQIPEIMKWYRNNMHKVQHLSLIALSGVPVIEGRSYFAANSEISEKDLLNSYHDTSDIEITTKDILNVIHQACPDYWPSAYISGDARPESDKQLFIVSVGSSKAFFGVMGAKSMELTQVYSHLFTGKYFSFVLDPEIGKKVFFLSLFDKQMRKTFRSFLKHLIKRPVGLFDKVYLQSLIIQQPIDFIDGVKNVCEHCVNPMVFNGQLINPCELDEYRVFGDLIFSLKN